MFTPDDILKLNRPTDGFLCPTSANTYGLEFLQFTICNYETKDIIFEVGRDLPPPSDITVDLSAVGEDLGRKIKYNFSEDVLRLPLIQTSLIFGVGQQELNNFRMIERHYFKDELVKSFDFTFGFCIPGSTNTWDTVYSLPPMTNDLINDMIDNPYETRSDSFYFVDNKLIMHNKASYKYFREEQAAEKKSYEDKYGSKGAAKQSKAGAKSSNVTDAFDDMKIADSKDSGSGRSQGSGGAKAPAKDDAWSKD